MCSLSHYEHTTLQIWLVSNCPTCYKHVILPTNDILNPIEGVLQLLNYSQADCVSMTANVELKCEGNPKSKEKIFFLCEECLWTMTSLDKSRLDDIIGKENTCPMCFQDQLSSFPLILNHSFTYAYSERRGLEVKFGVTK